MVNAGARPVFADVDRDSQTLTVATVTAALTPATKAIVCVHLAGWPCDMDALGALAEEHGLWLIEDCAQAHGATWKGRPVGGLGHVGCWSFCQDKIMTTGGEGGMVTTTMRRCGRGCGASRTTARAGRRSTSVTIPRFSLAARKLRS